MSFSAAPQPIKGRETQQIPRPASKNACRAGSCTHFQRAAGQRFTTAEFLLRHRYALDAMYLAGYTIECTLKALIL